MDHQIVRWWNSDYSVNNTTTIDRMAIGTSTSNGDMDDVIGARTIWSVNTVHRSMAYQTLLKLYEVKDSSKISKDTKPRPNHSILERQPPHVPNSNDRSMVGCTWIVFDPCPEFCNL